MKEYLEEALRNANEKDKKLILNIFEKAKKQVYITQVLYEFKNNLKQLYKSDRISKRAYTELLKAVNDIDPTQDLNTIEKKLQNILENLNKKGILKFQDRSVIWNAWDDARARAEAKCEHMEEIENLRNNLLKYFKENLDKVYLNYEISANSYKAICREFNFELVKPPNSREIDDEEMEIE